MPRNSPRLPALCAAIAASAGLLVAANATAQCEPHWEGVGVPEGSAVIRSMIWHDDGTGPALVVAGSFASAAGTLVTNIARFPNGSAQGLGDGLLGMVYALATYNDGTGTKLYAGGTFTTSGNTQVNHLAAWNGTSWMQVGGGVNSTVRALAVHNDGSGPALFIGGDFNKVGPSTVVSRVARWNGTTWNNLRNGVTGQTLSNTVNTLLSVNSGITTGLYAGGRIVTAGGFVSRPVVRWTGSSWISVGTSDVQSDGVTVVNSLAVYDPGTGPALYRATDTGVKRLDGSVWTTVATTTQQANSLFVVHDGSSPRGMLYVGLSGQPGLLKHDGVTTTSTGVSLEGACFAMSETQGGQNAHLLAGGTFARAESAAVRNFAEYSAAGGWQSPAPITQGGTVTAIAQSADESVTYVGTNQGDGLYRLAEGELTPLSVAPHNPSGRSTALELVDFAGPMDLIAAGSFVGSASTLAIADWRNDALVDLPALYSNVSNSNQADDLCWSGTGSSRSLLMSGRLRLTTDTVNHGLLRYSASGITMVAPDPIPTFWGGRIVSHMTPQGEEIYITDAVGGSPTRAPVYRLSPTGTWTPILAEILIQGGRLTHHSSIAWFDDGDGGHLYFGGSFDTVNGKTAQCIARVVGNVLKPMELGVTGLHPLINDLAVFDDGNGPALYAAGRFKAAGGVDANNIARFKHGVWSAVGGGVTRFNSIETDNPPISRLKVVSAPSGDWLYAMGNFMVADGMLSPKLARYGRAAGCRSCPADFNHDDAVDFFDYLDFVQALAEGNSAADFDHDSVIDFFDYLDFVAAFSLGC